MNFKNLFSLLLIALLVLNCSSDSSDDRGSEPDPDPDPTALTYNNDIKSIIDGNCLNCHGNPRDNGAPTSYTTYNQVKASVDQILNRTKSTSTPMPPQGPLNSTLVAKIQQWKDDGLLED